MFRDKWVFRFYMFLLVVLLSLYYAGESRNRKLREIGFSLCEINGLKTWSTSCPQEMGFLGKDWSK